MIGHEWDGKRMIDTYWISSEGRCYLVAGEHMRHAEMEEVLTRDEVLSNAVKTLQGLQVDADNHAYYDFTRAGDVEPPGTVFEGDPSSSWSV